MPYSDPLIQLEHGRAYVSAYRLRKLATKLVGTCSVPACRNQAVDGFKKCPSCREYMQQYKRGTRKGRTPRKFQQVDGICAKYPLCEKPSRPDRTLCLDHSPDMSDVYEARNKERDIAIAVEVLSHYGPGCVCCGETTRQFLSIDHIDGERHGSGNRSGAGLYRWLRKNGFPAGFRTLCMNCNFCLGHHGYCPHGELTQKCAAGRPAQQAVSPETRRHRQERNRAKKVEVLVRYGGPVCTCCAERQIEFLTLDHVGGSGGRHRRELFGKNSSDGVNFYDWLRQNDYPQDIGLRVQCFNCNHASGRRDSEGACPHQTRVE